MKSLTYFISDTHLGSLADPRRRERERALVAWLESIAPTARRLYLLGDMLDFWWEYRKAVPRGHARFFGALARLADSGTEITWLRGNHDVWLSDYLAQEIPLRVVTGLLDTEINGVRFVLEHGDGVGRRPLRQRILRSLFHNSVARMLYSSIHPRWGIALANAWSRHSRLTGARATADSPSVVALADFSRGYAATKTEPLAVKFFIYGHLHCPLTMNLGNGAEMVVLGDWLNRPTYAVFDGNKLETKEIDLNAMGL